MQRNQFNDSNTAACTTPSLPQQPPQPSNQQPPEGVGEGKKAEEGAEEEAQHVGGEVQLRLAVLQAARVNAQRGAQPTQEHRHAAADQQEAPIYMLLQAAM